MGENYGKCDGVILFSPNIVSAYIAKKGEVCVERKLVSLHFLLCQTHYW